MTWFHGIGTPGLILVILILITFTYSVSAASYQNSVVVNVKDTRTQENLGGALVYLDGGYIGETSLNDKTEILVLQNIRPGIHTVRVTRVGFKETMKKFVFPGDITVNVEISRESLVSLNPDGPAPHAIDVVFYPSSTSYNCSAQTKVSNPTYITNETRFRDDVQNVINRTYLDMDTLTSRVNPLPENYRERFNFYYYYDPTSPADAFSGCAGTVPVRYWTEVPFSDVTVILYPTYYGIYSNISCQPTGCNEDSGPGHNLMKAPADKLMLFNHETGHAVYGLIDTYCGDTYYSQNDPYPNVWTSVKSCTSNAVANHRDPEQCQQIQKKNLLTSPSCVKDFWQWDPNPDIMANGYEGTFGPASTQRINYILSQSGGE